MNGASAAAIPAKIRAQFGKMLTKKDYDTLLRKKTVPEIAAFLKNETAFKPALENIQEMLVHRGQLENLLRKDTYNKYINFLKYTGDSKNSLYFYYIVRAEIEQILNCILYINAGTTDQILINLPMFLISKSTFNMNALAGVKTFSQLLNVLIKTPYYAILKDFDCQTSNKPVDYLICEIRLLTYFYTWVFSTIATNYTGKEKRELNDVFLLEAELFNLTTIFRLKHFYNVSPNDMEKYILPFSYKIKKSQLASIVTAKDEDELFDNIKSLNYAKYGSLNIEKHTFIESFVQNVQFHKMKRFLRFSIYPSVTFASYIALCNIEINNIITIIEVVRYNVSPDETNKLIIN